MDVNLKQFKLERLDPISPTFCAAKWLMSDIYLHTGVTSSCHFPNPHHIDFKSVEKNCLSIHNTAQKLQERNDLLQGIQTPNCSNCWNIENTSTDVASDRIYYSQYFREHNFNEVSCTQSPVPEFINVVFDNLCNLSCSYCDGSQSSTWQTNLKQHGLIKTNNDPKLTYRRYGDEFMLSEDQSQSLQDSFVKMVIENLDKIRIINVLGGEPTMSPKFWKFIDSLAEHDVSNLTLSIISNGSNVSNIQRFVEYKNKFLSIGVMLSIDGTAKKAEFFRGGLQWDKFEQSVRYVLEQTDLNLTLLGTISALSIDGLVENLDWFVAFKKIFGDRIKLKLAVIRWPNFQAIQILPLELKQYYRAGLSNWLHINEKYCNILLLENINQIIALLDCEESDDIELCQGDLKLFAREYSSRQGINMLECLSSNLAAWLLEKE